MERALARIARGTIEDSYRDEDLPRDDAHTSWQRELAAVRFDCDRGVTKMKLRGAFAASMLLVSEPDSDSYEDPYSNSYNDESGDLDCADIGHSVEIGPDDPNGLDADGDGIGCESYGY